jgi:hypothetical protein
MAKHPRKSRKGKSPAIVLEADRGTPEFQAKVKFETVYLDRKAATTRVRDKRPIDKYHRLYKIDEENGVREADRRGISDAQYRAADRIACNHEKTHPRLSRELVPMVFDKGINVGAYPLEIQIEAMHLHDRLLRPLNNESRSMVRHICCYGECLNEYEATRRWRKGYGMIRLREALDELVESFRSLREPKH